MAIERCLEIAKDFGIKKLQVEMDASLLHQMLIEVENYGLHQLGMIIHEVAVYVKCNFEPQFLHVRREANMVAHKLAKL